MRAAVLQWEPRSVSRAGRQAPSCLSPCPSRKWTPHEAGAPGRAAPTSPPSRLFPRLCRRDTFHEAKTSQELVPPKKWLHGKKRKPPKKGLDLSDFMSFGQRRISREVTKQRRDRDRPGGHQCRGKGGGVLGVSGEFGPGPRDSSPQPGLCGWSDHLSLDQRPCRWDELGTGCSDREGTPGTGPLPTPPCSHP